MIYVLAFLLSFILCFYFWYLPKFRDQLDYVIEVVNFIKINMDNVNRGSLPFEDGMINIITAVDNVLSHKKLNTIVKRMFIRDSSKLLAWFLVSRGLKNGKQIFELMNKIIEDNKLKISDAFKTKLEGVLK